jgi:rhodanese-related sulfurtransferase
MRITFKIAFFMTIGLAIMMALSPGAVIAQDVPLMTTEELNKTLPDKGVLILDARRGSDWSASEFKIQGAVRAAPDDVETWADKFPKDKKVVIYCA